MTLAEIPPTSQPGHPPAATLFESYRALLVQLDRKLEEQGILDPGTWIAVDGEIRENPGLAPEQVIDLHAVIENRLRQANGGWG